MTTITLDDGTTLDRLPSDAATAARITAITGYLYLRGYERPLPAGLAETGDLYLRGYAHPLPTGLLGDLPILAIPDIDRAILAAAERDGLNMSRWHCGTTHCRAGWAVHLAGKAGYALEDRLGPAAAGALIYEASRPGVPRPDFYCDRETALADLRKCAAAA